MVKKHISGEGMLVDYANDFICALRCKQDAENFMLEQKNDLRGLD